MPQLNKKHVQWMIYALIAATVVFGFLLTQPPFSILEDEVVETDTISSLDRIKERGYLHAITNYNSSSYFIYRGQPMGFQYDMLKAYCEYLDVELKITVYSNVEEAFQMVNNGDVDLIGVDLTNTLDRQDRVMLTIPHSYTRQVFVQRQSDTLIENTFELAEKDIYVERGTVFSENLSFLSNQLGEEINIIEDFKHSMEELVVMVSEGKIDYTICDEHVALVNQTYFNNLNIDLRISPQQKLCWAVGLGQDSLLANVNGWLDGFTQSRKYALLDRKYFKNKKNTHLVKPEYHSLHGGKVSPYDDLIKSYSEKLDWDWRLLAAIVYQESRFNPAAASWAGAQGLMQLMPRTAKRFGVEDRTNPEQSLSGGVQFLAWLEKQFAEEEMAQEERIKFVLASYNVGYGHVKDARALALKNGYDPNVWSENVDSFLLFKSKPEYYNDEVVKYGYCRGSQAYKFVNDIWERYDRYADLIEE
jgi:membrane-bound lytic murein transglycosylase F